MAGGRRVLMSSMDGVEFSGDGASVADMMFGFYEVGSPESCTSDDFDDWEEEEREGDKGEEECLRTSQENKAFWEKQQQLLHVTLSRTRSLESGIRKATKEALKNTELTQTICICNRGVTSCQNCFLSNISDHICKAGYNSAICKSKWRSSPDIPSGEHTYIDVVDNSNTEKGEVRVVIELNFRAEFEMARASEEYNQLIAMLPEIFVGKADRLRAVIKIICSAGKKCMKEKKMHMGPWRKRKYMQAKWFGAYKRTVAAPAAVLPQGLVSRLQRPRASMLTFDLLENLPGLHYTAVEVL